MGEYHEPWKVDKADRAASIKNADGDYVLFGVDGVDIIRAIVCVNACEKMKHPEEEIAWMKNIVEKEGEDIASGAPEKLREARVEIAALRRRLRRGWEVERQLLLICETILETENFQP